MTGNTSLEATTGGRAPRRSSLNASCLRFTLATAEDDAELQRFASASPMAGAIRICFDRAPDYLGSLRVEGQHRDVLIGREEGSGQVVAVGHRSIKAAFVNGESSPVGYLSGLRVTPRVRSGRVLERGYAMLRALHDARPARIHLSTIMEDNAPAQTVLLSRRFGLPAYRDLGRFCCMAISLRVSVPDRRNPRCTVRRASASDSAAVVEFLRREGRSKQFFPEYAQPDFGRPGGLLAHLEWHDVWLAFLGHELTGVIAAWDQRRLRRWRVAGYAPWLRVARIPLNLAAAFRRMPALQGPGSELNYFVLSLVCIKANDRDVFRSLLTEVVHARRDDHSFFLAGLHERDPLLPELATLPHVPLHSRVYAVAWDDGMQAVRDLDWSRVPYLEVGSL